MPHGRCSRRSLLIALAIGAPLLSLMIVASTLAIHEADQRRPARYELGTHSRDTITAAIEGFREARGRYPSLLEDLVPEFLPAVPPRTRAVTALLYRGRGDKAVLRIETWPGESYSFENRTWVTHDHWPGS